jgi:hypothetical protein
MKNNTTITKLGYMSMDWDQVAQNKAEIIPEDLAGTKKNCL